MLSLIVLVVSVSEECYAGPEEEAYIYAQTPLSSEEIERLKNPASSWQELDSIVRKIYLCPDLDSNMQPFGKLYESIKCMPGGIRLFAVGVVEFNYNYNEESPELIGFFENYKEESSQLREFFERFEGYWQSVTPIVFFKYGRMRLIRGNIIDLSDVDAIVNTTNEQLTSGGKLYDAILSAAGPSVQQNLQELNPHSGGFSPGTAFLTEGGKLKPKIIHVVKPRYDSNNDEGSKQLLVSAYKRSLEIARADGIRKIAFPCISAGACGYPSGLAAAVAMETVIDFANDNGCFDEITFCCLEESEFCYDLQAMMIGWGG
jgi:O-acetyl-ADP-ribose deacetylase (regulator of RNase III)